jgi:hypothetical protein
LVGPLRRLREQLLLLAKLTVLLRSDEGIENVLERRRMVAYTLGTTNQ